MILKARLAQSVERQTFNLVVGGSSPPSGEFLFQIKKIKKIIIYFYNLIFKWILKKYSHSIFIIFSILSHPENYPGKHQTS